MLRTCASAPPDRQNRRPLSAAQEQTQPGYQPRQHRRGCHRDQHKSQVFFLLFGVLVLYILECGGVLCGQCGGKFLFQTPMFFCNGYELKVRYEPVITISAYGKTSLSVF